MIQMVLLSILFILTLILQSSLILTLGIPFAYISLPLFIGLLIMHRGSIYYGISWFILVTIFQWIFGFSLFAVWIFPVLAVIAALLITRLFTNRSIYAFTGLYLTVLICAFILQWIHYWQIDLSALMIAILFALPMSYIGSMFARGIEKLFSQFILDRS